MRVQELKSHANRLSEPENHKTDILVLDEVQDLLRKRTVNAEKRMDGLVERSFYVCSCGYECECETGRYVSLDEFQCPKCGGKHTLYVVITTANTETHDDETLYIIQKQLYTITENGVQLINMKAVVSDGKRVGFCAMGSLWYNKAGKRAHDDVRSLLTVGYGFSRNIDLELDYGPIEEYTKIMLDCIEKQEKKPHKSGVKSNLALAKEECIAKAKSIDMEDEKHLVKYIVRTGENTARIITTQNEKDVVFEEYTGGDTKRAGNGYVYILESVTLADGTTIEASHSNTKKCKLFVGSDGNLIIAIRKLYHHFSPEEMKIVFTNSSRWRREDESYRGLIFKKNGDAVMVKGSETVRMGSGNPHYLYREDSQLIMATSYEEAIELLKASNQKNSLAKLVIEELYKEQYESTLFNMFELVRSSHQSPVVENLYKVGFKTIAGELIKEKPKRDLYKNAKSVYDIMGFKNRELMRFLRDKDVRLSALKEAAQIYELDRSTTIPVLERYLSWDLSIGHTQIILHYVKKMKNLVDYLDAVLAHQCIEPRDSSVIWADYLSMADELNYRLDNRSTLYPSSLKKEHDIAMFSYMAVKDKVDSERFKKAVDMYRHLEWVPKTEKYQMIVPTKPEDIVSEGKALRHCVGSYVNRVKEMNTRILFLRQKDDVDTSFYTVEASLEGRVTQIRGQDNRMPTLEVKDFVRKWAVAKRLEF